MTLTSLGPELTRALYSRERTRKKRVYASFREGEEHETSNACPGFGAYNRCATVVCRRQDRCEGRREESGGRRQGDRKLYRRATRSGDQERPGGAGRHGRAPSRHGGENRKRVGQDGRGHAEKVP